MSAGSTTAVSISSSPVIQWMKIYCDISSSELKEHLLQHTQRFSPNVIELPDGYSSFTSWWEAQRSNYFEIVDCKVSKIHQFECFVTDRQHLKDGDVVYALYSKDIPVLSLQGLQLPNVHCHSSTISHPSAATELFHTPTILEGSEESSAQKEAITKFFTFGESLGRVFVIEGGDGAGKQTQTERLRKQLTEIDKKQVRQLDFPHDRARYGSLIREVLSGKLGSLKDLDPMLFASLYGLNRHATLPLLNLWLQRGYNVLLDRYMTANFGYQATKFPTAEGRCEAINKLKTFETQFLQLPPAHRVIYLDLPPAIAFEAMLRDSARRELDMHEKAGLDYKEKVRAGFLWCCDTFPEWDVVRCADNSEKERLSRDDVAAQIYKLWKSEFV
mmetsp:Transcript_71885/g.83551  ORF Transcript_71885/g.83551 Transcript_71885/m.83551 type:complete len:387 (+) Transcript_71885:68-1228(+)